MAFSAGVQVQGLQKRKLRQAVHDEWCRRELEQFLEAMLKRREKPSLTKAVKWLERRRVPAPRGGKWSTAAVFRIGQRLNLVLVCGRAFGEFRRCGKCNRQVGRVYGEGFCLSCERRRHEARVTKSIRALELEEAREKLAYYRDKVKALESGSRHYSRQHPERREKFGRPRLKLARGQSET